MWLLCKPGNLSSVPGAHIKVEGETIFSKLSSDLHTNMVAHMLMHIHHEHTSCTHIIIIIIIISNNVKQQQRKANEEYEK